MSLILEALKKSERQRRLGESPSIGSPIMAVRQRRNWLPYLVVLIGIGLAVLWWVRRGTDMPVAEAPRATQTDAAVSAPATGEVGADRAVDQHLAAAPPARREGPASSDAATRLPRTRIPGGNPAGERASVQEKLKSGELVAADAQVPAPQQPITLKESEAVPASALAALPDAGVDPGVAAPVLGQQAPPAPVAARIDQPEQAKPREPKPASGGDEATTKERLALIWELPLATRRELPEITLTMHVFAEDPAQRFVIVNGDRHVEGDIVGTIKLIEIRRDGVVFEHDDQRFLYPRGGR